MSQTPLSGSVGISPGAPAPPSIQTSSTYLFSQISTTSIPIHPFPPRPSFDSLAPRNTTLTTKLNTASYTPIPTAVVTTTVTSTSTVHTIVPAPMRSENRSQGGDYIDVVRRRLAEILFQAERDRVVRARVDGRVETEMLGGDMESKNHREVASVAEKEGNGQVTETKREETKNIWGRRW